MSNPRIEEVDDASDPEEMDVDAFDFARPGQQSLQSSMAAADPSQAQSQMTPDMLQQMMQQMGAGGQQAREPQQMDPKERERRMQEARERTKAYQCIYPIYFDASRSREEGRRVKKEDAVRNPLAAGIMDALQHIGDSQRIPFKIAFEPSKTHPKDWANPGRVRVLVKEGGRTVNAKCANKHHLYKMIAEYMRAHPTTEKTPLEFPIHGIQPPKDKAPTPAVPRGFKMGTVLPLHSPALTGGGVSDNMMADMMRELQGAGGMPEGMAGPAGMMGGGGAATGGGGGQQKKVKDKKKK